jgi:hypothetical protein
MLEWHLGMGEGGDGRPRERMSGADAVTLVRVWLAPAAPAAARSGAALPALIAAGGITVWLDGALAAGTGVLGSDGTSTRPPISPSSWPSPDPRGGPAGSVGPASERSSITLIVPGARGHGRRHRIGTPSSTAVGASHGQVADGAICVRSPSG